MVIPFVVAAIIGANAAAIQKSEKSATENSQLLQASLDFHKAKSFGDGVVIWY